MLPAHSLREMQLSPWWDAAIRPNAAQRGKAATAKCGDAVQDAGSTGGGHPAHRQVSGAPRCGRARGQTPRTSTWAISAQRCPGKEPEE